MSDVVLEWAQSIALIALAFIVYVQNRYLNELMALIDSLEDGIATLSMMQERNLKK